MHVFTGFDWNHAARNSFKCTSTRKDYIFANVGREALLHCISTDLTD